MDNEQIARILFEKFSQCENYKWDSLPQDNGDKCFWRSVVMTVKSCLEK